MSCALDTIVSHLKFAPASDQTHALRKLRALVKAEASSYIVENAHQVVACMVLSLQNDASEHFSEWNALMSDIMPFLRAQTTRIFDEILPYLVNRLIHCDVDKVADSDSATDTFHVLNQFLLLSEDVYSIIKLFIDAGLRAVSEASTRENTIECIFRILQDCRHSDALSIDRSVVVLILNALVCALDDENENVVVAAECSIAKLQNIAQLSLQEVNDLLSPADRVTFRLHEVPIAEFLDAITESGKGNTLSMRAKRSLPESIINDLESSQGNSNADWKNRSRAIRQLAEFVGHLKPIELGAFVGKLASLLGILGRLLHDVDLHIVKHSLQVAYALFKGTCVCHHNVILGSDTRNALERYTSQFASDLIELMTLLAEEDSDEVTLLVYRTLPCFLCSCRSPFLTALLMESFRNRRWKIREQGLRIWILSLLLDKRIAEQTIAKISFVEIFAKLLCDVNARVREMSLHAAVAMDHVGISIYSLLEHMDDEALRNEIDFARLKQILASGGKGAQLLANGTLHVPKMCITEAERNVRSSVSSKRRAREETGNMSPTSHPPSSAQSTKNIDKIDSLGLGRCRSVPEWRNGRAKEHQEIRGAGFDTCLEHESLRCPVPVESTLCMKSLEALGQINTSRSDKLILLRKKAEKLWNSSTDSVNAQGRCDETTRVPPTTEVNARNLQERPIRPLSMGTAAMYATDITDDFTASVHVTEPLSKTKERSNLSLATRKRMEARQQKSQISEQEFESSASSSGARIGSPKVSESTPRTGNATQAQSSETKAVPSRRGKEAILDRQSSFEANGTKYVQEDELKPFSNPKAEVKKLMDGLHSSNWEENFQALTSLRRLAVYHSSFLEDRLHEMILEILSQVRNLRSSVSKNALLAMDTLSSVYGKGIDAELEHIVPLLLKRCADSNAFVCESASNSILAILRSCSLSKVFAALLSHSNAKAVPIRREVARSILRLIQIHRDQIMASREQERIISLAGKFLEDTSSEVRDIAKECFWALQVEVDLELSFLKRFLSPTLYLKVEKIGSQSFTKNEKEKNQVPRASSALKSKRKRPISGSQANLTEDVEAIVTKLDSSDWKERLEAISSLKAFVMQHAHALNQSSKSVEIFDCLVRRMDDGNLKVSLAMMEEVESILSALHSTLESALGMLLPVLSKNVSSNSNRIAALSKSVLQSLHSLGVEPRNLCQQLAAITRNTNTRSKAVLIECVAELIAQVDDRSHAFVIR